MDKEYCGRSTDIDISQSNYKLGVKKRWMENYSGELYAMHVSYLSNSLEMYSATTSQSPWSLKDSYYM